MDLLNVVVCMSLILWNEFGKWILNGGFSFVIKDVFVFGVRESSTRKSGGLAG